MKTMAASLAVIHCLRGINVRAIRPFPTLATPPTVSPTSATEQKQHHKNNQYGFHMLRLTLKGSWTGLCDDHPIPSLPLML